MPVTITTPYKEIIVLPSILIRLLGGASDERGRGIISDSSHNCYIVGETNSQGQGGTDLILAKYSPTGSVVWQRMLGGAASEGPISNVTISPDYASVYVTGMTSSQGQGNTDIIVAKYANDGNIVWQRAIGASGSEYGQSIVCDSNGVYIAGHEGHGTGVMVVVKYDTAGTLQWVKGIGGTGTDAVFGIDMDSGGNVYIAAESASTPTYGSYDLVLAKYNSSGAIQWQQRYGGSGWDAGRGISIDSSDNIYITGITGSSGQGNNDILIVKYNSSGALQWQRTIGAGGHDDGHGITTDSSGNVYIVGETRYATGYPDIFIAKYDSGGTLQWQRLLRSTNTGHWEAGYSITHRSSSIYITGYTSNNVATAGNNIIYAKLPDNGSGTGTYSSFIYEAATMTGGTPTLSSTTGGLTTYETMSFTSITSTLEHQTSTLTATTVV